MKCETCPADGYSTVASITYANRLTANLCTVCRRRYEDRVEEFTRQLADNIKEDIMTETQRVVDAKHKT